MDSLAPENRGAGFSFQSAVSTVVLLPAPIIAQYLVLTFNFDLGMPIAYTIVTVTYFAIAFLRLRLKETLLIDGAKGRPSLVGALRNYSVSVKEGIYVWRKVPKSAFNLFLAVIIINGLVVSCQTYFVVYATSILKMSLTQWAIVVAFRYLTIAIPAIMAGFSMDVLGRKRFLILGYLLYLPGMLLFINADFNTLLLAFFFFGLGNILQLNRYQVLLGDLIPRNMRGTVVGSLQFFMFINQAVFQVFIGFLYAFVSPQLPFLLLAASAIPLSIFVFWRVHEPIKKEA
jgi:MFS family permease